MQNKKYLELDALAAPNGYVAPPTKEDLAYVVHFRKTCQRYQIDFAKADSDERVAYNDPDKRPSHIVIV